MPSRMIRDQVRTSDTLAALSDGGERLFYRLLTFADDFGRFEADHRLIRAGCFALLFDAWTLDRVKAGLEELVRVGLVVLYRANGRAYGYFVTWDKYQRLRKGRSKHPDPPPHPEDRPDEPPQSAASADVSPQVAASCRELPPEARSEKREAEARSDLAALPAAGGAPPDEAPPDEPPAPEAPWPIPKKPPAPSWSAEACDDWKAALGGTPPGGPIGRHLKPLVDRHGWAEVRHVWQRYLAEKPPEFANPADFASKYGHWRDGPREGRAGAQPRAGPKTPANGSFTPEGEEFARRMRERERERREASGGST